ncbi:KKCC2 kinase, partial [Acromyrmex charruanus]
MGSPRKYRPPRIGDIPRGSAVDSSPSNSPTSKTTGASDTEQLSTDAPGPSKVLSSPEYIQEVRKDSALYLEESEGTLKTVTQTTTDVLRRQSSGYVSRRDSLEDNRRNSTSDTQQQEKERYKSKSITLGALIEDLAGRKEENIEENIENIKPSTEAAKERMPTTEIYRKVSSSNLEMPDVDETKEVVREKTLPRQKSFETQEITEGLTTRLSDMQVTSIFKNPNIYLPRNSGKNAPSDEAGTIQRVDTVIDHSGGDSNCKNVHKTNVETIIASDNNRTVDLRKLSLPDEAGPSQRLFEKADVTYKSVHSRYPHASPHRSPRKRIRALNRECSVDSQHDSQQQLNQYKVLNEIGKGSFGVVKKVFNEEDGTYYAMKIVSKRKLMKKTGIFGRIPPRRAGADPLAKVYREIAILKKLDHPNVVKLVEVLDHPDKDNLYLVFELVHRGEILLIPTDKPLNEETARRYFRDVVLGVEYLHYQKIVHRDIKPSNLLVDRDDRIKIADLGVSTELRESGELLTGQAGTPAFAAPETTVANAQYLGPPCDIWSMGITLYALVIGDLPWRASDSTAIQEVVRSKPLIFPDNCLSSELRYLIEGMLDKSPETRLILTKVKQHPWLTNNATEPLPAEVDNCRLRVTVTEEEVIRLGTLLLVKNMLKQHSFQNPFLPKRLGRTADNDAGTESPATGPKVGISSSPHSDTMRDAKAERFHEAGRSNSAPDSYDWHTSGSRSSGLCKEVISKNIFLFAMRVQSKPQITKLFPVEGLTAYHKQFNDTTKSLDKFWEKLRTTYNFVFQPGNTSNVEKILAKNASDPNLQTLRLIWTDTVKADNYTNLKYPSNTFLDQIKSLSIPKSRDSKATSSNFKKDSSAEIKTNENNVSFTNSNKTSSNEAKILPDDDWFNDIQPLEQLELQDEELDKKNEVESVTPGTTLPTTVGRHLLEWLGTLFGFTYSIYNKLSSAACGNEKLTQ